MSKKRTHYLALVDGEPHRFFRITELRCFLRKQNECVLVKRVVQTPRKHSISVIARLSGDPRIDFDSARLFANRKAGYGDLLLPRFGGRL